MFAVKLGTAAILSTIRNYHSDVWCNRWINIAQIYLILSLLFYRNYIQSTFTQSQWELSLSSIISAGGGWGHRTWAQEKNSCSSELTLRTAPWKAEMCYGALRKRPSRAHIWGYPSEKCGLFQGNEGNCLKYCEFGLLWFSTEKWLNPSTLLHQLPLIQIFVACLAKCAFHLCCQFWL